MDLHYLVQMSYLYNYKLSTLILKARQVNKGQVQVILQNNNKTYLNNVTKFKKGPKVASFPLSMF